MQTTNNWKKEVMPAIPKEKSDYSLKGDFLDRIQSGLDVSLTMWFSKMK